VKYKPTAKFKTLDTLNHHQGLSKDHYARLMAGKTTECEPPERLVKDGYLMAVKKKASK